jgi:DNA-binding response OmpR family regulator
MRTILVVDDHIATLETLCLILQGHQFNVLTANNALQAEEQFASVVVDLVIVDHGLPGKSGAELAHQFKSIRRVLVIMLSGNPELLAKPDCVDLLLAKPISVPNLLFEIDGLLANCVPTNGRVN